MSKHGTRKLAPRDKSDARTLGSVVGFDQEPECRTTNGKCGSIMPSERTVVDSRDAHLIKYNLGSDMDTVFRSCGLA
jgi:hypothetical protein